MTATNYLFSNVRIFDGSGVTPYEGQVLVEGTRISQVARASEGCLAIVDCQKIDGRGAVLMPGLVEGHAHLTWPSSIERVINAMRLPIEEHLLVTAQNARITIDHGFTSAYSAGSLGERFEPVLRDMINAGYLPGPRLRASALEKGAEGVMGVPAGHDPTHDRDIPGLVAYVKAMKDLGCDTIKFLMSVMRDSLSAVRSNCSIRRTRPRRSAPPRARSGSGLPATPKRPKRSSGPVVQDFAVSTTARTPTKRRSTCWRPASTRYL